MRISKTFHRIYWFCLATLVVVFTTSVWFLFGIMILILKTIGASWILYLIIKDVKESKHESR